MCVCCRVNASGTTAEIVDAGGAGINHAAELQWFLSRDYISAIKLGGVLDVATISKDDGRPAPATTLRWRNGKVSITDGPYAETKEQIGGILILEARDLNHAIQLMSKHPGVKAGPFEIRPAADLTEMVRESEQRRGGNEATSK